MHTETLLTISASRKRCFVTAKVLPAYTYTKEKQMNKCWDQDRRGNFSNN